MGKFTKEMGYGSQERWADFFMKFYKTTYDELKEFVIPRGKMIEVLEKLKEHGHKIVLATNPIFPSIAIEKRIFWIGLNPEIFDYITSMENSYNVKPSEKYYRYILEKVDCPPDRSFMIGNDSILDGGCVKAGIQFILDTTLIQISPSTLVLMQLTHQQTAFADQEQGRSSVSIHAPVWGATATYHLSSGSISFQSTPPYGGRLTLQRNLYIINLDLQLMIC